MSEAMNRTRTPDEIRRDIEHTREELADTAAALAERADVKARAHEKLDETKARITGKVDETKAKVTGKVDETKAKVTDTAGTAKEKASDATPQSVASKAQQAADSVAVTARENPIPTTLIAGFAGGLLIGWFVASRRA
jgi:ElaB/YqjD/DUF883 family membrane-anchored ribosome-binding protein